MTNIEKFEEKWNTKLEWTMIEGRHALVIYNKNEYTDEPENIIAFMGWEGITYLIDEELWDSHFIDEFKIMARTWRKFYFPKEKKKKVKKLM